MPSLRQLGLDQNPSKEPLSYPGRSVPGSCLVVGSWLYPIFDTQSTTIAEWSVKYDNEGPLRALRTNECTVGRALHNANAVPMTERLPVLAVGSNASPGQLAYKYARSLHDNVIPVTCVTVTGITVAHSAHVSVPGYIPYAPVLSTRGCTTKLHALWLDAEQIRCMDMTEPNYRRVPIHVGDVITIRLESGAPIGTATLYAGRWGVLRIAPNGPLISATTQSRIFTVLGSQEWFQNIVPESLNGPGEAQSALAQDAGRRERVRKEMAEQHLVAPDNL